MEHRDQRQESHGVHVCNKCGWPFPNPHPSAKHRRAHKRICGTIDGFKLVESEPNNTIFTVSDDDGPKVLGESCSDKCVAETKAKSKESEDEVFSDAAAQFSDGVRPDTFNSVSMENMVAGDEMNSPQTLKHREVLETSIDRSGVEQKNKINQEFVNLDDDFGTPSYSFSNEKQKVENLVVVETAINRSEKETEFDRELATRETDFETPWSSSSTENGKVEISVVPEATVNRLSGTDQDTKISQELANLETGFKSGDSVVFLDDHMNTTTTASDLYSIDTEAIVPPSSPSPDTRYVEKKNERFGWHKNLPETATSSGETDNDKVEPVPKMEGTIEILTEPTAYDGSFLSMVDEDTSIHFETPPSAVVVDVKPIDLTQVTSDPEEELESCSCSNNLRDTDKLKEGNDDYVHPPSVSSDLNVVDSHEGFDGLEGNFKDSFLKESYSTLQVEPFDQASEVPSFDTKIVENREKQEKRVKNASVDAIADCFGNSSQFDEILIEEMNATRIGSILGENEKRDSQTLDGIPSASFSPESETMSSSNMDNLFENVSKVLTDENPAARTGNENKFDDNDVGNENNAEACGRKSEDTVQVHHLVDARGRNDRFDNLDIAGVEDKKIPSTEKFLAGIDEYTADSRENECSTIAEEMATNESPRKFSGTEGANSKSVEISLGRDFNTVLNSSDVRGNEETNLVSVDNESVTVRSDASRDGSVSQLAGNAVRLTSETWQEDSVITDVKSQLTSSLLDTSVDVSSQTDSLEGNWGSVSVLSTQSDLPAVVNGEVILPARAEAGGNHSKNTEAATTERQQSDISDSPPTFMTWVEPNGQGIQNSATSEIQTARNLQQQETPASLQAGWFPSCTHVANDSPGRKKNEAVIAKVTNWSTGKPHTALKNLLDDAALENKQKSSPARKENLPCMVNKEEKWMNDGTVDRTAESVSRAKAPVSELGKKEIPNEWNSPARYPSEMRRERRKGKPYWAQFVCCSSVH